MADNPFDPLNPSFDLNPYGGNFSGVITQGGVPFTDINSIFNPNSNTERSQGYQVGAADFASRRGGGSSLVIYGRAKVGGEVTFLSTDQEGGGEFLHIFVTLAGHEIDAVEKLYLDDKEVTFGGGTYFTDPRWGLAGTEWDDKVFMSTESLGSATQVANEDLVAQSAALFPGQWTEAHRQRGCAGVYLILVYDPALYTNSVPTIQFLVRGKKVYDPRTTLTVWSDNAALCLADYLADSTYGCKVGYSGINTAALEDAADVCDEAMVLNGGGSEPRYTVNGSFETSRSRKSIIDSLRACIGFGPVPRISNQFYILPSVWREPTLDLTEDDLRSNLRVRTKTTRRDNFNAVKGTFISPDNNYEEIDFPPQTNSFYLAQDNDIQQFADLVFELIDSSATAQRIAKIVLERARQQITVEGLFSLKAYKLIPGDTVTLTLDRWGWDTKEFEVITVRHDRDSSGAIAVALTLRETAEGVYDWNDGEETLIDLAPDTNLPDPTTVLPLTGLVVESGTDQLFINGDGTIITRALLTWDTPADPFVNRIEIQFKRTALGDDAWQNAPDAASNATHAYIVNLQDEIEYDFRIRPTNGSGFHGAYLTVEAHLVLGKSEPPSDVINFVALLQSFGVHLAWDAVPDVDLSHYEIRHGGSDWTTSTVLAEVFATQFTAPFTPELTVAGEHKFFIRAVDTSGNYSFFPSGYTLTVPGPATPLVTVEIIDADAVFDWEAVTSFFAIARYEIYIGATYLTSTLFATTPATFLDQMVFWSGTYEFWFVSVDVAGNKSDAYNVSVTIVPPSAVQNLHSEAIDNFATLLWATPLTHTLPIAKYRILKGEVFGTAEFVGEVVGTFFTKFEQISGTYVFWVQPVDTAGNYGTESSIGVFINQPADYVLLDDRTIGFDEWDTYSNVYGDATGNFIIGPVDTTQTYEDHFLDNSFDQIIDFINAGYTHWLQPGATTGYVELKIDYGTILGSTVMHLTWDFELLAGTLTIEPTLSYSDDDISYTDVSGVDVLATDFRYVKVKLLFDGVNDLSLGKVSNVRLKLDVRVETDQGFGNALAADSGGTETFFNLDFIDVQSITVTPQSTTPVQFAYDFVDIPDPTSFFVYIWDGSGMRIDCPYSWTARGVRRT